MAIACRNWSISEGDADIAMRIAGPRFRLVLVVSLVLVALAILFRPWLRPLLPHAGLVKAWFRYLVDDLQIERVGPVAILLLVALIELGWVLVLGRRSGLSERQLQRLQRRHDREIAVLNQEIVQLQQGQSSLRAELELRRDLIREERVRLWARFEELLRASGLSLSIGPPESTATVPANLRGEWRQIITQLERIEMVGSLAARDQQDLHDAQERAEELRRLGMACYQLGQYERALTHYSRAIDLLPKDSGALISRAVVNYALGRNSRALQDLERALREGESAWAHFYRGLIHRHLGQEDLALEDFTQSLQLEVGLVAAYHHRGLVYAAMGEYEQALADQNEVLALDSTHAGAYTARGVAVAALGKPQQAMSDLDRGCALSPTREKAFYFRGQVWNQLEMHHMALADFTRAIELSPESTLAYMARGDTYLAMDEQRKAIADYSQFIELRSGAADGYFARGKARAATEEYELAIRDFDRALELDPGMAAILTERGAAHARMGETDLAIGDLDRAIALDANLGTAYYIRGLAYGSRGEYDRASQDLNKAAELDPSLNIHAEGGIGAGG
jgi:tetratricopeptide (TPR) repeat protein